MHCDDGIRHVEAVLEEPTNLQLMIAINLLAVVQIDACCRLMM